MNKLQKVGLGLGVALTSGSAFATGDPVPTAAEAAFTSVGEQITAMESYAWPIVVTMTLAVIGISLFKKFAKKSAS